MGRQHKKGTKLARSVSKALSDSELCMRDYVMSQEGVDMDTIADADYIQGNKRVKLESSIARMGSARTGKSFHKELIKAKKLLAAAEDEEMLSQSDYGTMRRSSSLKHARRVSKREQEKARKVDRFVKEFSKEVEEDLTSLSVCGDCGKEHAKFPGLSCADCWNNEHEQTKEKWTDYRGYGYVWQKDDSEELVLEAPEWEERDGWELNKEGFFTAPDWVEPEPVVEQSDYEGIFADAAATTAADERYGEWEQREGWERNENGFFAAPDWQEPEKVDESDYEGLWSGAAAVAAADKRYGEWEEREGWERNENGFFAAPDWVEPQVDEAEYKSLFHDASAAAAAEDTYSTIHQDDEEDSDVLFARASARKAADEIYKAALEGVDGWEERPGWSFQNGFYTAPTWEGPEDVVDESDNKDDESDHYYDDQESSGHCDNHEPSAYCDERDDEKESKHYHEEPAAEETGAWEDRYGWDWNNGYYTHWSWQTPKQSEGEWTPSRGWDWSNGYQQDWAGSESEGEERLQVLVGGWESRDGYELGADGYYKHWSWREPQSQGGFEGGYYADVLWKEVESCEEEEDDERCEVALVGGWQSRFGYELNANGYYTHPSWVEPEPVVEEEDDDDERCEVALVGGWQSRFGYELNADGYYTHPSWVEPEPVVEEEWEQVEKPWEERGWELKNGFYTAADWVEPSTEDNWETVSCCSSETSWEDVDHNDFGRDYDGFAL